MLVSLTVAACLVAGVLIYLLVSFASMRAHTPRRTRGAALRELLREALWVALTQPLLPLYYVVGRKMAGGDGTPVIFVHGYSQNRVSFFYLSRALARRGVGPSYGYNYSWLRDVPSIAQGLARFVQDVKKETGAPEVDLVCHSMGGLVAVHYLANWGGRDHVRRAVTIATPHRGVKYRGPILGASALALRSGHGIETFPDIAWLSIYSSHDNVVHPSSTSHLDLPIAKNLEVSGVAHLSILCARETADAIAGFLREPAPARKAVLVTS